MSKKTIKKEIKQDNSNLNILKNLRFEERAKILFTRYALLGFLIGLGFGLSLVGLGVGHG